MNGQGVHVSTQTYRATFITLPKHANETSFTYAPGYLNTKGLKFIRSKTQQWSALQSPVQLFAWIS